jgi:hypothetical protein
MIGCSIIILVSEIVPELMPNKWHHSGWQNVSVHQTMNIPVEGHKGRYYMNMDCSPDMGRYGRTTTSLHSSAQTFFFKSVLGTRHILICHLQDKTYTWTLQHICHFTGRPQSSLSTSVPTPSAVGGGRQSAKATSGCNKNKNQCVKSLLLKVLIPAFTFLKICIYSVSARANMKRSSHNIREITWSWRTVVFFDTPGDVLGCIVQVIAWICSMQLTV